jgi:hypothetical protein
MKISELKNSRFLTKDDCDPPITVTISHVTKTNVAPADQAPEERWVMHFKEPAVKPMVLNITNGETIASITGSDDSDDWTGKQIVLYHEPNVGFAGKRVGGIRVRAPAEVKQPEAVTADPDDSDIPW